MGKLKTIYLALLNRKFKIVRKKEIVRLIEDYNRKIEKVSIKNALWYLSRRNYIRRIFLDYYYVNSIEEKERKICNYDDKDLLFEVLNKLKVKWYIGLSSALYNLGKTWQIPNILIIINNKFSGKRKVFNLKVKFIKIKDPLIFGLIKGKTKTNVTYFYSDFQKTDLDMAYFRISGKLTEKNKKTKKYLKKYPKWLQKLT